VGSGVSRLEAGREAHWTSQIHRGLVPLGDGPVTSALLVSVRWERVEQETDLAFVVEDVDVFPKGARP
jgi:hypothetical protein